MKKVTSSNEQASYLCPASMAIRKRVVLQFCHKSDMYNERHY
jgi:hypothetical protein